MDNLCRLARSGIGRRTYLYRCFLAFPYRGVNGKKQSIYQAGGAGMAVYAAVMPVLLSVIIVIAGFLGFEYALFFSDAAEDAAGAFFFIIFTVGSYLFLYVLVYQYIFLREKHKGTRFLDMWCNMSLIPLLLLYMTTSFTSLIPLDGTGAGSLAAEFVRAKKERGDIRTQ